MTVNKFSGLEERFGASFFAVVLVQLLTAGWTLIHGRLSPGHELFLRRLGNVQVAKTIRRVSGAGGLAYYTAKGKRHLAPAICVGGNLENL